jgi:hypothetical protein
LLILFKASVANYLAGAAKVTNLWGYSGIFLIGGGYEGSEWKWNQVVQLWTVNQTASPLTFTKVEEKVW